MRKDKEYAEQEFGKGSETRNRCPATVRTAARSDIGNNGYKRKRRERGAARITAGTTGNYTLPRVETGNKYTDKARNNRAQKKQ